MKTEGIEIPLGTSFDNKGITDAEKAFSKFGKTINQTLKEVGSDKSMDELGKSVQTAFDAGLKGSTALMKKFSSTRLQAAKTVQEIEKLSTALANQKKITDKVRDDMTNVDNAESQQIMKKLMSSSERKKLEQYEEAKSASQDVHRRYEQFRKENDAALEGLDILKQVLGYRKMEESYMARMAKYKEAEAKLDKAHYKQRADYFNGSGAKNYRDMQQKHLDTDSKGNPSKLAKGYDALRRKQQAESDALKQTMPKTSEKLEALRNKFQAFMTTYRTEIEKFDKTFGEKDLLGKNGQLSSIQSWLSKLNASRLVTDMDGVRKLSADAVAEEQRLLSVAQDASAEWQAIREEIKEIFNAHVEETEEVKEQVQQEHNLTEEEAAQLDILKAQAKELDNMGTTAQASVDNNQPVPESGNFKDALKQVFSWQRVFTILGRMIQNLGEHMQDLSRKILGVLVNIGKLGAGMMKAFGSAVVRGVTTIGNSLKNMRSRFQDMIPSLKQVSRFLVKYIFGFRTMYFLVRKVRQAIGEGFKAMAKVDPSVNKSISALQMALNQLKGQLGASFAPLLNAVVPLLIKVINLATQAAVQIGAFLATLTGQHTFKVAIAENVDYAKSLDKTSKSAGKAAKAIKAYLSPLDELNRMDDPNKNNGGAGSGGIDPNDLKVKFKNIDVDKLGISDFAKKLKAAWKKQDWEGVGKVISDKLAEVFGKVADAISWKKLEKKIEKITDIISGITNGISKNTKMWENLGKVLGEGFNTAIKTLNRLLKKINWTAIGSGVATALGKAIEKIDPVDIAQYIENKFTVVLDLLNGFMGKMQKDGTWKKIAEKIVRGLNGVDWYSIAIKIFDFAGKIFNAIRDILIGFISQGGFAEFADKLVSGINDSIAKLTPEDFKQAGTTLSSTILVLLGNIGKIIKGTKGSGEKILDGIKEFFKGINWESILTDAGDIAASLANGLIEIFGSIGEILNKKDAGGESLAQKIGAKIGEALGKIDFKQLGTAFGNFGEALIEGIISAVKSADLGKKFSDFLDGVFASDSPLLQKLMSATPWLAFGGAIVSGIGKALPLVLSANQATGGKLASLIGQWMGNSGAVAGSGGVGVQMAGNIAAVGVAIAGVKTTITGCTDAWNLMTGKMTEADFGGINKDVTSVGDAIKNVTTDSKQLRLTFALGFQKVGDAISEVINKVNSLVTGYDAFTGETVPSVKGALKSMGDKFMDFEYHVGKVCVTIGKGFADTFSGIGKAFSDFGLHVKKIWEETKTTWKTGIDGIKSWLSSIPDKAKEAWDGIKNAFGHVADWFKEKFEAAWNNVKKVFSTGGQIFSGIKEGLEKTFKTVVNKIIDGMNTIIKKPFDKLNDIITTLKGIKIAGIEPFKSFKTISVPQIPKLAQGAVIPASKPFLAMLGDQKSGNNIEAPESLIRQIVREESGGNNGKTTVVAKVGRRELFEIVLEEARIRQQTTGRNPFEFT